MVRELSPSEAAAAVHVSPSFVVKPPKNRLVVDLSAKNADMKDRPFAYDSLPRYAAQLSPGDHLCTWDISGALFHVPLAPAVQARLAFRVGHRVFVPLVLPFRIKLSPFVFSRVMRPVVATMRAWGMAILAYRNKFACRPPDQSPASMSAATAARIRALRRYASLGIAVHPTNGAVCGTTALPILEYVLETARRLILLLSSRLASLVSAAQALSSAACSHSRRVPFKALQRFTGNMVSCSLALPAGRLYIRRLYAAQRGDSRSRTVRLTHVALRDFARGALWPTPAMSAAPCGLGTWAC